MEKNMSAKKIVSGVFSFLFVFLLFSCNMGMTDEMYYQQQGRKSSGSGIDFSDEIVSADDDDEVLPEGQVDPFKEGEWNDITYGGFDGSVIGDYIFKVSFDGDNIPEYQFVKNGRTWNQETAVRYTYNGTQDGNKAQGYEIAPANFYRYNGYNPLSKKAGTRLARFQFYALLNSKAVVAELNQYLIAVDTYSKLIFAYGKITGTKYISAANQTLPIKYDAVDFYKDNKGEKRKFYEYDPIGALKYENGQITVKLYGEYKNSMKRDALGFFPQVVDPDRAIATYDKEGRSPYFAVLDLSNLPQFLQDVAKKTYLDRPKVKYEYKTMNSDTNGNLETRITTGFGLVKTEYEFSSDGKSLTFTKKNDRTGKTEEELTYTFVSAEDDVSATYNCSNGTTAIFKIDGSKLLKDGEIVGDFNFDDPGADFILRVRGDEGDTKGRKYVKYVHEVRKSVVYQFSADGGSVTTTNMTGQKIGDWASGSGTYYFVQQKDGDSEKAVYQWYGGEIVAPWYLLGITAYTNPYYGLNLSENDTKVYRTRAKGDKDPWKSESDLIDTIVDYFSADSEVGVLTKGNVNPDELVPEDFLMLVANFRFMGREQVTYSYKTKLTSTGKQERTMEVTGNGFTLYDWKFSDDGKAITQTSTDYNTGKKTETRYTFVENQKLTSATEARYTSGGKEYTFKYNEENARLYRDGAWVGEGVVEGVPYKDYGPDFILRVRGAAFVNGNVSFVFSPDGGSVVTKNMQGLTQGGSFSGDGTYYFVRERNTDDVPLKKSGAVYQLTDDSVTGIGDSPIYALMLSNNDNEIIRSTGIWNTGDPPWLGTGSATCYRTSMLGKEFASRSTTYKYKDENYKDSKVLERTGNGFELDKYKFSNDGKTMTHTKTNWQTGKTTTEATYTYIDSEPISKYMLKGKYKDNNGGEYTLSYDVANGTLKFGPNVKAYANYKDPGPDFILRVRNKTYIGSEYIYTIDEYGVITDQTGKKYYFAATRDGHPSTTAVYWEGGAWLIYRGLKITEDGSKLWWTPTAWATVGTTDPTTLATSAEAVHLTSFKDYVKGKSFSYTSGSIFSKKTYRWTFSGDGNRATKSGAESRNLDYITNDVLTGKYGAPSNPVTFTLKIQNGTVAVRAEGSGEQANYFIE